MKRNTRQRIASTEYMVDYDRHSHMQDAMIRSKAALLRSIVDKIGPVAPELVVADYGCGPGHSAIDAVLPVIEAYRRLDPTGQILIRHADQPGNDWNALFAAAFGPEGYRREDSRVRSEAAIGSFYGQLAAPASVDLATCFAASHWLSRAMPLHAPGTVWFADLEGDARHQLAGLARADWVQFLRCRARELRPGGHLVVATLGSTPDAREPNGVRASAIGIYRAIFDVARGMADDGLLSSPALDSFVFPIWFPTLEDATGPVGHEQDLADAFEVVLADVSPAAFHPRDVYEDDLGDPARYAELYAGYVRGFAESSLRLHLFDQSAGDAKETDDLTEEFFRRFASLYKDEPGRHAAETMIMTLALRRR